jgi:hypothetical protein
MIIVINDYGGFEVTVVTPIGSDVKFALRNSAFYAEYNFLILLLIHL